MNVGMVKGVTQVCRREDVEVRSSGGVLLA